MGKHQTRTVGAVASRLPVEYYNSHTGNIFATRFDSLALRPPCDVKESSRCTGRAWYRLAEGRACCSSCLTAIEVAAGVVLQSRPAKAWAS